MSVLLAVVGAFLVVGALADAMNTLVSTRLRVGRNWPSERFYTVLRPMWRAFGRTKDERRREALLSVYAPATLVGLLVMWVLTEIVGWALIYWALRESFSDGVHAFSDTLYFSGVVFFTIGFGDIVPTGGGLRLLTLLEAFAGLGTLALVIGYLPALYAAYSAREAQLLMLDDLTGDRVMPVTIIESYAPGGDLESLYDFFHEWERWIAQVLETHTSYPMLTLFRSQHLGQSWITALGVVVDAAVLCVACIPGAEEGAPMRMYRRGNRTLHHFVDRLKARPAEPAAFSRSWFRIAYGRLAARGIPLRDFDEAYQRTLSLRSTYSRELESLIEELQAPRGFWSHSLLGSARAIEDHASTTPLVGLAGEGVAPEAPMAPEIGEGVETPVEAGGGESDGE